MLINPILDKLRVLGLEGMLKALEEQLNTPEAQELGFEERLGLMVDRKAIHRATRRLKIGWPRPSSGMMSNWRTSTTGTSAVWINHSSWFWPHTDGSLSTTTCLSADPSA
ncbi:hypothetical protein DFAR_3850013 [Desulfarculales bacterium]